MDKNLKHAFSFNFKEIYSHFFCVVFRVFIFFDLMGIEHIIGKSFFSIFKDLVHSEYTHMLIVKNKIEYTLLVEGYLHILNEVPSATIGT